MEDPEKKAFFGAGDKAKDLKEMARRERESVRQNETQNEAKFW